MVRRVFNIVYKEVRGLHQAAYVLALFAFGSQLLALLRDRMLAHEFGAGSALDVYYAAFRIPDLMYVLFASTLSVYVLIPFVARARENGGDEKARKLLSQVFTLFLIAYSVVALVLYFATPLFIIKIFPGIEDTTLLINVTRILLLQPLLLGVSSLFGVVTQLSHRFVLYAVSPLIYNIGIIVGIAFLYPVFGLVGIAYGVVLGAGGHMLIQWPLVRKSRLAVKITHKIDWQQIRAVLMVSVPRALTLSLNQIVLLFLVSFASVMTVGSVSVFQFAYNLQSVPLAIIGVSYSVAAFPLLTELYAKKEFEKFALHITTALRHIIFWSVPAIALIIVLRAQIVRVVLGSGEFDWGDTRLTAAVLALLSLALLAQAINLLIIRVFYAGGHTRIPFYVSLCGALLAVVSAYSFYVLYYTHAGIQEVVSSIMRLDNVVGSEVLAIAFGYAVAVILQSLLLLVFAYRTFSLYLGWMPKHLAHAFIAALSGGVSAYATLNFLVDGINPDTFVGILIQGVLSGIVGLTGVAVTYAGFRSPELAEVYAAFQKKLFKTNIVAPEKDIL